MDLKSGNIVIFRGEGKGVVTDWNGKPSYVVGARFTNPTNLWDENGRYRGKAEPTKYDIIKVIDGSSIEEPTKVFRTSAKLDELPIIWEEGKE